MLAMTIHPEVQKKGQAAVDEAVGRGRLPDFNDDITYVDAIVREVLRWHPVLPLSVVHAVTENDIYKGYHIPAGAVVIGNAWAILHDETTYGPRTDQFIPERWLTKEGKINRQMRDPSAAFGFGRRIFPGKDMTEWSIWIAAASILAVYNINKRLDEKEIPIEPSEEYTSGMAWPHTRVGVKSENAAQGISEVSAHTVKSSFATLKLEHSRALLARIDPTPILPWSRARAVRRGLIQFDPASPLSTLAQTPICFVHVCRTLHVVPDIVVSRECAADGDLFTSPRRAVRTETTASRTRCRTHYTARRGAGAPDGMKSGVDARRRSLCLAPARRVSANDGGSWCTARYGVRAERYVPGLKNHIKSPLWLLLTRPVPIRPISESRLGSEIECAVRGAGQET
ncbi:Cytochrome p450 [Mycena sanguinolenta]|uniref:Cytochrome p450 n=1 Tax=Mycena sanguinolenta TaxID=230812 RepID=A0A8H7DEE6_9AGAR|nr:Cytochrome p450 [Mycena sanguinolenta]